MQRKAQKENNQIVSPLFFFFAEFCNNMADSSSATKRHTSHACIKERASPNHHQQFTWGWMWKKWRSETKKKRRLHPSLWRRSANLWRKGTKFGLCASRLKFVKYNQKQTLWKKGSVPKQTSLSTYTHTYAHQQLQQKPRNCHRYPARDSISSMQYKYAWMQLTHVPPRSLRFHRNHPILSSSTTAPEGTQQFVCTGFTDKFVTIIISSIANADVPWANPTISHGLRFNLQRTSPVMRLSFSQRLH